MTQVFRDREFHGLVDFDGRTIADMEFHRCYFGSSYSTSLDVRRRAVVRNVAMIACKATKGCSLLGTIVEDVLVDGLRTHGLIQLWGCVFKHMTLKGRIDRMMFSPAIVIGPETAAERAQQKAFDEANAAYYRNIDWALDISQAEFQECDIRGVPARLIRRDPETQVVVTRQKALEGRWRQLDLGNTPWKVGIEFLLLDRPDDIDVVLVAGKRDRHFGELLAGLQLLRKAGVAEPD